MFEDYQTRQSRETELKQRKGIILAGGRGSRLHPITICTSKQLLPVYDKPMIYYPLSVLMLAGIREICIIVSPESRYQFDQLIGDGGQWGIEITYVEQPLPDGIAQAYILAEEFLGGSPSALILGDNIFYGSGFIKLLEHANKKEHGGTIFSYEVSDPSRYGVVCFDDERNPISIEEKPKKPASNSAITGLYCLDSRAPDLAKSITPSSRGELEITELLNIYLQEKSINVEEIGRGYAWLDTGTYTSLLEAGNFVRTLVTRQGLQVGCPEEIAFIKGWIDKKNLIELATQIGQTDYGKYLFKLVHRD